MGPGQYPICSLTQPDRTTSGDSDSADWVGSRPSRPISMGTSSPVGLGRGNTLGGSVVSDVQRPDHCDCLRGQDSGAQSRALRLNLTFSFLRIPRIQSHRIPERFPCLVPGQPVQSTRNFAECYRCDSRIWLNETLLMLGLETSGEHPFFERRSRDRRA